MALPTYFGSGAFTVGAAAITPPFPVDTLENDIALLVCESENEAISLSAAQGFVEVTNSPQFAGTAATNPANRIAVFWKRLAGGDTAPTMADSGNHNTAQIHVFRGVKTAGDPWNITAGGNDGGVNDTSGAVPGATTTVADCLVVLISGSSFNGTSTAQFSGWTNADLANILERTDNTNTSGLGGGHGMATGEKAAAGAYGDTTVTLANTSFKGAMSIALEGAGAVTFFQTLPAVAIGIAGLSTVTTFARTLAATAVGVAMLATALLTSVTMAATAVGVATLSKVLVFGQTLVAVATGVASLVTEFIAGSQVRKWKRLSSLWHRSSG